MFWLLGWIIFGFFAGLIARALMPGTQKMGFFATTLLGVAGAFVGGFLWNLVRGYPLFSLHASGFVGAVIGALVLLIVGGFVSKR